MTIVVGIAYAAFSTRPWEGTNWTSFSQSERATQIRSWIDSNISQASSLTTAPWDEGGYSGLSQAQQNSKQRDWQYLKRRVSDEHDVLIESEKKKVLDSHATKEYFVPTKTYTDWNAFYNAVSGGEVPDLSLEDIVNNPPVNPSSVNNYLINNVAVGHRSSCAITVDHRAYCWGYNNGDPQWEAEYDHANGRIGDGTSGDVKTVPTQVAGGFTDWETIDTYHTGTCGIRNGGELYCWGKNYFGTVGDGTTNMRTTPQRVGSYSDWETVSVNAWISCGIRSGKAYCWGNSNEGNLGDGTPHNSTPKLTPSLVAGGFTDWENIATGWGKTCGIRNGGELWCWGMGWGTTTPHRIGSYSDWIDVDGDTAMCGLRSTGQGYCWNAMDAYTEYEGDGDNTKELSPQLLAGGHTWVSIGEACGVTDQGRAYCWGENSSARVGDGTSTNYNYPREVSGGYTDWVALRTTDLHTCGYRSNGSLYCWSQYNWFGETGTGSSWTPKLVNSITVKH